MAEGRPLERFVVGKLADFPPGSHPIVNVGGREVGIYNVDGTFYAVQNLCPHALAPICVGEITGTTLPSEPGTTFTHGLEGRVLRCIWHGWEFDVETGKALFGTDKRKLKTFPVEIDGDDVVVSMRPRPSARKAAA